MKRRVAKKIIKRFLRELERRGINPYTPRTLERAGLKHGRHHHYPRVRRPNLPPVDKAMLSHAGQLWAQKEGGGGILSMMHPPDSASPIERVGLWWKNRGGL